MVEEVVASLEAHSGPVSLPPKPFKKFRPCPRVSSLPLICLAPSSLASAPTAGILQLSAAHHPTAPVRSCPQMLRRASALAYLTFTQVAQSPLPGVLLA